MRTASHEPWLRQRATLGRRTRANVGKLRATLEKLLPGRQAVAWLLTVARNHCRNAQRRSARERAFIDEIAATTVASAEMRVEDRADAAAVMRALGELGTLDRDLILLVAWDELTPGEAGQVLGLHPATARSRLHRTRQRLTESLRERPPLSQTASQTHLTFTEPMTEPGRPK